MSAVYDSVSGKRRPSAPAGTRIRGGSGLGDAIYLRPICEHLARERGSVTVMTNFADVFLDSGVAVEPFRRDRVEMIAHYVGGKHNPGTTLWQDMCAHAGVTTPLRFDWKTRNRRLIRNLEQDAAGRPILLVHGGREPMGRRDKFGIELLPFEGAFNATIAAVGECFKVRIGRGDQLYPVTCDLDLTNQTSVADVLDIAQAAAGVVSMCGFPVPLAEALDKPALFIWSSRGLLSAHQFIKTVTPGKILSKGSSRYVIDDQPVEQLQEAARDFRASLAHNSEAEQRVNAARPLITTHPL